MLTTTYVPSLNGAAISLYRTARELRKQGHRVIVAAPSHSSPRPEEGLVDIEIPSVPNLIQPDYPLPVPLASDILDQLENTQLDLVHLHQPIILDKLAKAIAKEKACPLVFTYHSRYEDYAQYIPKLSQSLARKVINARVGWVIQDCQAVISTTQAMKKELMNKYDVPIYYASTAGLAHPMTTNSTKESLRKKYNLPTDKTLLLSVSRQNPEKNLELLLHSLSLLPNNYHLIMIGEGISHSSLQELAQSLQISDRVTFPGALPQAELIDYYSLADFFLFSSLTDTLGICLIEAHSAGLPIFAVDAPNTREIVKHQANGFLVPTSATAPASESDSASAPTSTQASATASTFAETIQTFPMKKYPQFSAAAKENAKHYMISQTVQDLVEVYKKVRKKYQADTK
jgi:1,2-diacylglycerol 3-alpha-glucosyltransferase